MIKVVLNSFTKYIKSFVAWSKLFQSKCYRNLQARKLSYKKIPVIVYNWANNLSANLSQSAALSTATSDNINPRMMFGSAVAISQHTLAIGANKTVSNTVQAPKFMQGGGRPRAISRR